MTEAPIEHALGVFPGIPNGKYHGGPGVSKSGLDVIAKSPLHFAHSRSSESKEPTPDQRIGTLAHALILEPESFWTEYAYPFVPSPDMLGTGDEMKARLKELGLKVSGTKSDMKARLLEADPAVRFIDDARAEYLSAIGDREVISLDELAKAEAIRDAVMEHPVAGKLLAPGSGVAELSCYWRDPETGVLCRCRPDWWRHDGIIVDLKTARDASPDGFSKSVLGWRYYVQDPFYQDGARLAIEQGENSLGMPAPTGFVFVAVEKIEPCGVGVYALDAESSDLGRRQYRCDLDVYAQCLEADVWPGYGNAIQRVGVPEWRKRQEAYAASED